MASRNQLNLFCVHITTHSLALSVCYSPNDAIDEDGDDGDEENQLNNKSFSLVRDRITRRQQIKWQRYIHVITMRRISSENEWARVPLCGACCQSIWNNFLGSSSWYLVCVISSTLSFQWHSMETNKSIPTLKPTRTQQQQQQQPQQQYLSNSNW